MGKNRPVHEIRLGCVKATIWRNEYEKGAYYTVSFCELYLDGEGNWQQSTSYAREHLPLLEKVASRAHTWCYEHPPKKSTVADACPSNN